MTGRNCPDNKGAELSAPQGTDTTRWRSLVLTLLLECTRNWAAVAELLAGQEYRFFVWDVSEWVLKPTVFDETVKMGNHRAPSNLELAGPDRPLLRSLLAILGLRGLRESMRTKKCGS